MIAQLLDVAFDGEENIVGKERYVSGHYSLLSCNVFKSFLLCASLKCDYLVKI